MFVKGTFQLKTMHYRLRWVLGRFLGQKMTQICDQMLKKSKKGASVKADFLCGGVS